MFCQCILVSPQLLSNWKIKHSHAPWITSSLPVKIFVAASCILTNLASTHSTFFGWIEVTKVTINALVVASLRQCRATRAFKSLYSHNRSKHERVSFLIDTLTVGLLSCLSSEIHQYQKARELDTAVVLLRYHISQYRTLHAWMCLNETKFISIILFFLHRYLRAQSIIHLTVGLVVFRINVCNLREIWGPRFRPEDTKYPHLIIVFISSSHPPAYCVFHAYLTHTDFSSTQKHSFAYFTIGRYVAQEFAHVKTKVGVSSIRGNSLSKFMTTQKQIIGRH